ncbi:MAG TPA: response regulator [Chloroflexota bacterium]
MSASHALRDKLFIVALVVAVVPLLAAGLLLATAMQSRLRAAAADDAAQVGEMVRVVAADRGQRLVASAQAFARVPAVQQAVLNHDRDTLLPIAQQFQARLDGPTLTVADTGSAVLVRAYAPEQYGELITTKGHKLALQGQTLSTTEVGAVRGLAIRGYSPIEAEGRVVGVAVITQNLDREFLAALRRDVGLSAFAITLEGATEGAALRPSTMSAIRAAPQGYSGFAVVDGAEQAIHTWPLLDPDGELSGYLGVVIPLDTLEVTLEIFRQAMAGAAVLAILGSMALAFLLSRRLLRPLEAIAIAARAIAAGEPRDIPRVGSGDEVEDLSGSLAAMVDARRAAERLKDAFVSMVSHELRTPLNGILGMTRLLLDTELTRAQREHAEAVQRSGDALLVIVNDILDFSKIEAGALDLECVEFDVCQVVEDVVALLAAPARDKGLSVGALVHPIVPLRLRGDPGRLRQILTNLVSNAIKVTDRGGVTIHARLAAPASDTVLVRFEVVDTGIGIAPEVRPRLFQPFFQGDASVARQYGGTGLGLAISKQLAERMGGEMQVDSAPGQGSTFWFMVRFSAVAASPTAAAAHVIASRLRVLVVGDTGTSRTLVQDYLASWRMEGGSAEDGAAALALLRAAAARGAPYDVALLDAGLSSPDSLPLARAIKADPAIATTRLVLLAAPDQDPGDAATEAGIVACLTKPVRQSQLLDALTRVAADVVPAEQPTPDGAAASAAAAPSVPSDAPRILVVEDSAINRQVAVGILEKLGYHADAVGDGAEALAALARAAYAAVLMDGQMPGLDGFAATAEIRRREGPGERLPIIAMTAHAMPSDRERCLAAGMDDYVAKPIRLEALEAALRRCVLSGSAPGAPTADPANGAAGGPAPADGATGALATPAPLAGDDVAAYAAQAASGPVDERAWERLRRLQQPGQPDVVAKYVALFLDLTPRRLLALREALQRGARDELSAVAHTLKGEAEVIGARDLHTLGNRLEQTASTCTPSEAEELVAALEAAFARARGALEARRVACAS